MRDNGNRIQSVHCYTKIELRARGAANDMCMYMSETCKNIMKVKNFCKSAGENDIVGEGCDLKRCIKEITRQHYFYASDQDSIGSKQLCLHDAR